MNTITDKLAEALRAAMRALDSCAQAGSLQAGALSECEEALAEYEAAKLAEQAQAEDARGRRAGWSIKPTSDPQAVTLWKDGRYVAETCADDAEAIMRALAAQPAPAYTLAQIRDGRGWPPGVRFVVAPAGSDT